MEKFRGFCRSIGKRETFTVKHFYLVLKMVGHSPGSSLKNSCDLLSALVKEWRSGKTALSGYRIAGNFDGGKF